MRSRRGRPAIRPSVSTPTIRWWLISCGNDAPGQGLEPADQRAFDVLDRPRDLDAPRAGGGAVEDGAAAEGARALGQHAQPFLPRLIPVIEDEAVGVDDGRGPHILAVRPVDRAGGRAGGAEDALGGVVVAGAGPPRAAAPPPP